MIRDEAVATPGVAEPVRRALVLRTAAGRPAGPGAAAGKRPEGTIVLSAATAGDIAEALCAIARPHLANPAWTLLETAKIGYTEVDWPKQYRSAKQQLERNLERERAQAAQGGGLSALEQANRALGA